MRTFLNYMKNELLNEIKTSLENLRQLTIQLSDFSQHSFVLILKRKCLVGASRVRCGESGTPSTIIYAGWSSRHYGYGCDAPMHHIQYQVTVAMAKTKTRRDFDCNCPLGEWMRTMCATGLQVACVVRHRYWQHNGY